MAKVTITGWRKGCNTVAATKEIRERAGMPLNEALAVVNRVLENEEVHVHVLSADVAQALSESLGQMGLIAVNDDPHRQEEAKGEAAKTPG